MMLKAVIFALCATLCASILNDQHKYRPCNLNDDACIRNSLRSGSRCLPPQAPVPSTLFVPQARYDTPAFNSSYVDNNLVIRGLDRCFVSEYYINRRTNSRVLAVDCPWLTFESNRIMYQHYPRSEDGVFHYNINGSYPLITVTTQFTKFQLDLCQEYSNAYVHALPIFNISPQDRPTFNHLTRDLTQLGIYEQETFAVRAPLLARTVINNKICNFGCQN